MPRHGPIVDRGRPLAGRYRFDNLAVDARFLGVVARAAHAPRAG